MTRDEKAALAMLVTLGATAMDTGLMEEKRRQFENRFDVVISDEVIVGVIKKMELMLKSHK